MNHSLLADKMTKWQHMKTTTDPLSIQVKVSQLSTNMPPVCGFKQEQDDGHNKVTLVITVILLWMLSRLLGYSS